MKNFFKAAISVFAVVIGLSVNAQPYNFDGLTSGAVGAFANGWVGSPTTNYSWIADAGGTVSGGTGPAVDHTLGTASGIYMYVEASTPAVAGDTASLTSPNITLTGSLIGFSFWYHMAGTSMGNMYIDVYNGSSWVLGVDSLVGASQASETAPWLNKVVSLAAFSGTVKVKFRAVCGSSWSGDMAIDDVNMVTIPPYDANLLSIVPSSYYYMIPQSQIQPMGFSGLVKSEGTATITGVTLNALVNGTTNLTGSLASISSAVIDTVTLSSTYTPTSIGVYNNEFNVSISETDPNLLNDSATYAYEVTDTVYARENDNVTQGIGFTGATGVFGQMFEVFTTDSLTSVSFKLTGPTISDNIKLKLYGWDSTTGTPGLIMDSTATFSIPSIASAWYTLEFPCDKILAAGKYFFAVEQLGTNNLTMGYTSEFYEPGVTWYEGGAGWTSFESSGFNVALAIRPNFGAASWPSIDLGNDTSFCAGTSITLTATSGWSSYLWGNGTTTASNSITSGDTTWVRVTNSSGCAAFDTIVVSEDPSPAIIMPDTIGICNGMSATLVANNDPSYTYLWSNGSTDSTIMVSVAGSYYVTVTGTNSCVSTGNSVIQLGALPTAQINMDTAFYCTGSDVTVTAVGTGNVYSWSNGTTGNSTQISQSGIFMLTVTSPGGCVAYDTAFAVENPLPTVTLSTNTLDFCDNEIGNLSVNMLAGATYLWSNGDTTSSSIVSVSGQYWVETTLAGCIASDTGMATRLVSPVVSLGADTLMCDTATLVLDGGSGSSWTWSTGAATQTISVTLANDYSVITESVNGCKGYDTITVDVEVCTTGINDLLNSENLIKAYPNPASDVVNLTINKELLHSKLTIIDSKGSIVYLNAVTNELMTIPVSNFTNGLYHVSVRKDDVTYSLKVVVKH